MRLVILFFLSSLVANAASVNYRDDGIFTAPSFSEGGVTVTGSSTLNFSFLNGIGVIGGLSDLLVDPAAGSPEYLEFQADGPFVFSRFSLRESALGNVDDGEADSFRIEGFDSDGQSIGTYSYRSFGYRWVIDNFVSRLGVTDVDRLRISAAGDSMLLQGIDVEFAVVPEPPAGILLLCGLALLPLVRWQRARRSRRMNLASWLGLLCIITTLGADAAAPDPLSDQGMRQILSERAADQIQRMRETGVFYDFSFADAFDRSGISFTNTVVEDALKYFKAAHYDHGVGLTVADVDADGFSDIYFVNQIGGCQLWRNLGNGRFENITQRAGVSLADRICAAASFADTDNDGDPDLFVTTVRMGNVLFENMGGGRFRDISKAADVNYSGHSSGSAFADVNRDGLLDFFVCNVGVYTSEARGLGNYFRALPDAFSGHTKPERAERSLLYLNQGGNKFREVSAAMGLNDLGWAGDAAFGDVNGDRYPDLYVLNMQGDDTLYINRDGKGFEQQTARFFPKTPWGSMGIKFFDFDQDGLTDLYVTDMHSDMTGLQTKLSKTTTTLAFESMKSEQWCTVENTPEYLNNPANNIFGNAFYRQTSPGKFTEISDQIGAETFWPWGISVGDVNADGYLDLYITAGMGYGFRYGPDSLLLNDKGQRFVAAEFVTGIEPRREGQIRKTAFILDCSGADAAHPLCRGRQGKIPVSEVLSSRSSAFVDMDRDGDLDLLVNEMDDRPRLLLNDRSKKGNFSWLGIITRGTKSNRDGLGAKVRVRAAGRNWFQDKDGKLGYLGQSSAPLYFGLGGTAKIEEIEVQWPSGVTQTIKDIAANQWMTVTEPGQ